MIWKSADASFTVYIFASDEFNESHPFRHISLCNKLMQAGSTKDQAEIQAEAIAELTNDNLATRRDLQELENRLLLKPGGMMAAAITILAAGVKLL